MDESNGDYKGTTVWKPHSDSFYKKRTPKFIDEIQAMIDNNLSKSIRSTARNLGVSGFLIRLCMKTFNISHTRWKRANFHHKPWRSNRKTAAKSSILSNQIYSGEKNFYQDQMVNTQQPLACSVLIDVPIVKKTKHPVHVMVFGESLAMVTLCLHLPSHIVSDSTQMPALSAWRGSAALNQEGGCWKTLATGLCTMPYKQKNLMLAVRKFLRLYHL